MRQCKMGRHLERVFHCLGFLMVLGFVSSAGAAMENQICLDCHGDSEIVGEGLQIDQLRFDSTTHGDLGCSTCHESVGEEHPEDGLSPSKAGCSNCHETIDQEYALTAHAEYASCGDCHNPHAVNAPTELSALDMNRPCANCHGWSEIKVAHETWLPQSDLHLAALPCISCHTASQNYVITLFISSRRPDPRSGIPIRGTPFEPANYDALKKLAGDGDIQKIIDSDDDGFISLGELKKFNGNQALQNLSLQGIINPETVTHDLQILDNRWDCTFCHASGPGAMQTSFLALPREDGAYRRLPVEKGAVLDALNGTPDFYMMGATRNRTLDLIGLSILAGGLVMPVGHGALRFLTRKNRR